MIEAPPLLTIKRSTTRPTAAQIAAFQNVPTGFVVDAMGGGGTLDRAIQPLAPEALPGHAAGPALTADNGAGDIMATLAALNFLQDGDILMIGFQGHQGCASAGDRVTGMARNCGAAGLITDGPMRDYAGLVEVGLPCWCTGLTPNTPYGTGPGRVGLPTQIGGRQVSTGDMVVADRDGVVIVPFAQIDATIAKLEEVRALEAALDAEVAAGLTLSDSVKALITGDTVRFVGDP